MKRVYVLLLAGCMLLGSVAVVFGARWETDAAHSGFYFTIDHIFSKVRGHFNEFTADINFDPATPAAATFVFVINTGSVDTNIAKRDKHLQSDDFFSAATFPEMRFVSKAVKDLGGGNLEVSGTLTVKDVAHDLVLPLNFAGVKEHPAVKGKRVVGFNGTIVLDRLQLGVGDGKFYEMGVVGKDVEVLVTIEALGE